MCCYVLLFLVCAALHGRTVWSDGLTSTELRMPGVTPEKNDLYLCTTVRLDSERYHYLVGFTPHASKHTAHHMLMFGCAVPGSQEDVWNCGEMHQDDADYESGPVCAEGEQIMYAWAMDAPEFKLPNVGGDTPIQYVVLQVHYMHAMEEPDTSGLTLLSTTHSMPKEAHVILLATNGFMAAKTKENFDTACYVSDDVELHPFAFRTHTHKHGRVVSGYLIRDNKWSLLGKRDPQKPQMFYPVANTSITIQLGDALAARCHMENDEDHEVHIGSTTSDEMCNFYLMYWAEPDSDIEHHSCVSAGPPGYHWQQTELSNIPKDADQL